ncbi:Synaptic vesicle transporter SVOP [Saitoella coloradoensis]
MRTYPSHSSRLRRRVISTAEYASSESDVSSESEALLAPRGEDILVKWKRGDPTNPRNFPAWQKWYIVGAVTLLEVMISVTNGQYSSGTEGVQKDFHVSEQIATLGQSLFVLGLAIGPMLLGPFSEVVGRKVIYIISVIVFGLFQIPCALTNNIWILVICRFIAGLAGSVPLANTGGTIEDMFDEEDQGMPMAIFSSMSTAGPSLGPVVGGYVFMKLGLPWFFWISAVASTVVLLVLLPTSETLAPLILKRRARAVRKRRNNDHIRAAGGAEDESILSDLKDGSLRAFKILFTEPIIFSMALYNAFLYSLIYMFFTAYPLVFQQNYHFDIGQTGLTFLGFAVGSAISVLAQPLQDRYFRQQKEKNGGKSVPESRLMMSLVASLTIPIGLFWFAFTSDGSTSPLIPIAAGIPIGFGETVLFIGIYNYIADAYASSASTALAAVNLPSPAVGGILTHVSIIVYAKLGTTWATALTGFVSVALVGVPYGLFFFGERVRRASPLAREMLEEDDDKSDDEQDGDDQA